MAIGKGYKTTAAQKAGLDAAPTAPTASNPFVTKTDVGGTLPLPSSANVVTNATAAASAANVAVAAAGATKAIKPIEGVSFTAATAGAGNGAGLSLAEETGSGVNTVTLKCPDTLGGNRVVTLKDSSGTIAYMSDLGGAAANLLLTVPKTFNVVDAVAPAGVACGLEYSAHGPYLTCNAGGGLAIGDASGDFIQVENIALADAVYLRATTNELVSAAPAAMDLFVQTLTGRAVKVKYEVGVPGVNDKSLYFDVATNSFQANITGAGTTDGEFTTSDKMAFGVLNS